ncbi:uncharacterized protein LOC133805722 [Humulus lupulus]|uniref:uncharacterized protein LOC133805722 n=1 Tax=Humulus lupulus TaxID=3486 RepID=UPI002B4095B0|nr:uncharacterized protein LOC133805722 [Humulus lupulus]
MNDGFTMVKFRDEATRDLVLESGVVHFDRKPMVLRPWTTDVESLKSIKSVPIWIRLPDLGLQYWGVNCLSALVITIGKPIMIDKITQNRSMIKFARILVEMEIADTLPKFISYFNENGQIAEQMIEYEWLPTKCSNCKKVGHSVSSCKFVSQPVWRKKEGKQVEGNSEGVNKDQVEVEMAAGQLEDASDTVQIVSPGAGVPSSSSQPVEAQVTSIPVGDNWISPKTTRIKKQGVQVQVKQTKNKFSVLQEGQKPANLVPTQLNKVGLGAFLETKIRGIKLTEVMNAMFYGWEYYSSNIVEGRILESDQLLHCQVRIHNQKVFCITFVYGSNNLEMRRSLWMDLEHLSKPSNAWLVLGDFNATFSLNDRMGGRPITDKEMEDARHWLDLGLVEEMKTMGPFYTWSNNQEGGDRIFSKLDRVSANETWMDEHPLASVGVQWEFREVFLKNWNQPLSFPGRGLDHISWKLLRLKHTLKSFNWKIMGDVVSNYERSKLAYQQAHSICLADPSNREVSNNDRMAYLEFKRHEKLYASYISQKSKIDWLRFGDSNSSFFHSSLKKRKLANRVVSYVSADGKIVDDYDKVSAHFLNHFRNFLGSTSAASGNIDFQAIGQDSVLSSED